MGNKETWELRCWDCKRVYSVDEAAFWVYGGDIYGPRLAHSSESCNSCVESVAGRSLKAGELTFGDMPIPIQGVLAFA